jgi:hypothetical protein
MRDMEMLTVLLERLSPLVNVAGHRDQTPLFTAIKSLCLFALISFRDFDGLLCGCSWVVGRCRMSFETWCQP